nr:hypothetical protein MtrunA17_Chr8g0386411 [Ipomoea trifida]
MLNSPSLTRGFEVCKELWKMSICKLGPLADFMLLLLGFGLVGHAVDLCHRPPLCSVCSGFHSVFQEIFFNVEHVTGQFDFQEELFDIFIDLVGITNLGNHPRENKTVKALLWVERWDGRNSVFEIGAGGFAFAEELEDFEGVGLEVPALAAILERVDWHFSCCFWNLVKLSCKKAISKQKSQPDNQDCLTA